jgi:signal transduction histidine kinase
MELRPFPTSSQAHKPTSSSHPRSTPLEAEALPTYQTRELTERFVSPTLHDIPERKQSADVLSVVAHDLRAPLTVIAIYARAVEDLAKGGAPIDAAKVQDAMRTIRETTRWMDRMIQDLLDAATIDAGRLSFDPRPTDVVLILMQAAERFEPLAADRSIHLTTDVPDHLPVVPADAARVLQVVANLLGNAIKFTQPGGEVTMRASATPTDVVVSVVDTGPGILPEHVSHVFDRFWRAHHTSNGSQARGAGLGLAIAKGIVEAHGGRIWVESRGPGTGSAFHFTLPVLGSPAVDPARAVF